MSFSRSCGVSIVPLLARLVLGVVFISAGYTKIFSTTAVTPMQGAILQDLGLTVYDGEGNEVARAGGQPAAVFAAFRQDDVRDEAPDEGAIQDLPTIIDPPADDPKPVAPAIDPLPDGVYTAAGVHEVTLLCHDAGWPAPVLMGWLAAITELAGGALILVGFLSRIWAIGLAAAMGSAFYLVSIRMNHVLDVMPMTLASEHLDHFSQAALQLALFALAVGVLFTGAGTISVDHMLFRRDKSTPPSPSRTGGGHFDPAGFTPSAPAAAPAPAAPPPAPHVPSEEPLAPRRSTDDPPPRRPL